MRTILVFVLAILWDVQLTTGQHDLNQYPTRSVIAQMFEWKFSDIADECEKWLGPKGYGAVQVNTFIADLDNSIKHTFPQVSPVNEHLVFAGRPWWERYQPISYKIQTRSGNETDFLNMSRRCNASGVRVYVDVVLNHMAGENPAPVVGSAGSSADPIKYSYPGVPYSRKHFHKPCTIEDWNDAKHLRTCQFSEMPDLNQTQPYVRKKIVAFLDHLVDLGAAGFRVDSAKHMWPADLKYIFNSVKDLNTEFGFPDKSRPFIINELVDFGSSDIDIGRWEYKKIGRITDFLFCGEIGRAIRGYNNLKYLRNWGIQWNFLPPNLGVIFLVDHDIQRGRGAAVTDTFSFEEPRLYQMATAFMLAHPHGLPRILSSYKYIDINQGPPTDNLENIVSQGLSHTSSECKNDWVCEHRWHSVANMVGFRNEADDSDLHGWWDNGVKQIAFSRGERAFIAINGHAKRHFDWRVETCVPAGTYCDIISGEAVSGRCTGASVEVDQNGLARIFIDKDNEVGVFAIHTGAASSLRSVLGICNR